MQSFVKPSSMPASAAKTGSWATVTPSRPRWARVKSGRVETGTDTGLDRDMNCNCGLASMHHGSFFANLSAGYVAMDFQFDGAVAAALEGDVEGFFGGLQLGANWAVGDVWQLGGDRRDQL